MTAFQQKLCVIAWSDVWEPQTHNFSRPFGTPKPNASALVITHNYFEPG